MSVKSIISPDTAQNTDDLATPADLFALMKPKVMLLVVFTAAVAMLVAANNSLSFANIVAILATALGSGGAAVFNMWYDRDIDAIMTRTRTRPIPGGKINASDGLSFAIILSILSLVLMILSGNLLATATLAFSIFFYAVIYTMWLKRSTPQNIVWGGAAGAFPPIIGWLCITGEVTLFPCLLFLLIFMWTPPHFWALALYRHDDYKRANVPMMPVTNGVNSTKWQMLAYTVVTVFVSISFYYFGFCGIYYLIGAVASGIYFLALMLKVLGSNDNKYALKLFGYSIFYLFFLFSLVMIDFIPRVN